MFPSASSDKDILLDDIECTTDDTTLLSCQHGGVGINNCAHFEDVVVYCDNHSSNVATRSPSSTDCKLGVRTAPLRPSRAASQIGISDRLDI